MTQAGPDAPAWPSVRRRPALIALAVILAVGAWPRLHRLGALGLTADEGRQALAVAGVLETGLPRLPSGLVQPRSAGFLALQAASVRLLGDDELALRLPSALLGLAAVAAAWLLVATLWGRGPALLVAAFLALSAWEIELSRYARFYTGFQAAWMLVLTCAWRGFFLDERRPRAWLVPAVVLALSMHELAKAAALLPLLALLRPGLDLRRRARCLAWTAGLAGLAWAHASSMRALRRLGEPLEWVALAPVEPQPFGALLRTFGVPQLLLPDLSGLPELLRDRPAVLALLALIPVAATAALVVTRAAREPLARRAIVAAACWAAFFHQLSLVPVLLLADAVVTWRSLRDGARPAWLIGHASTLALFLAWWLALAPFEPSIEARALALFGFPNLLQHVAWWLVVGWPVFTAVVAAGALRLLGLWLADRGAARPAFALGAVALPMIAASFVLAAPEARYVFHHYPLLVAIWCVTILAAAEAVGRSAVVRGRLRAGFLRGLAVAAVLLLCRDTRPLAAWDVVSRDHGGRKDPVRSVINWRLYARWHPDHEGVARWVLRRLRPADRVVVLGPSHALANHLHYLGRVDVLLSRAEDDGDYRRLADGTVVDSATAVPVVVDEEGARRALEPPAGGRTFVVSDRGTLSATSPFYPPPLRDWLLDRLGRPDHVGRDGMSFVRVLP